MSKLKQKRWEKVTERKTTIKGRPVDVAIFQKGDFQIEVVVNEIDHVERITTSPKRWLHKNPVIPIGERDDRGRPLYKVIRLNKRISDSPKTLVRKKRSRK